SFGDGLLFGCLQTWRHVPPRGKRFKLDRPQEVYIFGIGRDFYQLALMDLFGLLAVDLPPQPVQPWSPAGGGPLPFRDAVFTLLADQAFSPWLELDSGSEDEEAEEEAPEAEEEAPEAEGHFGKWQPLFQPYFPDWRENLTAPETPPREG